MGTADRLWRSTGLPSLVAIVAGVIAWRVFSAEVAPSDLLAFLDGARSIRHGVSPYLGPTTPALWAGHAFVYPYATGWAFAPLTTMPVTAAKALFFLISFLALVLSWWLFGERSTRGRAALLVITVGAEPVIRGLQLGTINALLLLGLALAWRFRDHTWVAVPALVATVVAKLFLVPMIGWLVLTRRVRPALAVCAGSAAVVAVGCWAAHIRPGTFADMLSVLSAHESVHSSSLLAALVWLGLPARAAFPVVVCVGGLIVVTGGLLSRRTGDERHAFVACVLASLAASPIVWSHYYTLLVVIPLLYRWTAVPTLTAFGCSWLLAVPNSARWLRPVHAFPGAGLIWAAALAAVGVAGDWARRAATGSGPPPWCRIVTRAGRAARPASGPR